METIGYLELNSIARGINAADAMLKAAEVKLISAKPCCPGKYVILVHGEVAAVKSAVDAGNRVGGSYVIERDVIPQIHPQVIPAITMCTSPHDKKALGILEFLSITASIIAADAAVKAAEVDLLEIRLGTGLGGKSFITMTGEVAAVTESVKCGAAIGGKRGLLLAQEIIPYPRAEIFDSLL